jgi:hypothetical protein
VNQSPAKLHPFNRNSCLLLGFGLALIVICVAQLAYRLAQPTDGWLLTSDPGAVAFDFNLLGAASPIHSQDQILSIGGIPYNTLISLSRLTDLRLAGWQAGKTVPYVVQRGNQVLSLDVPLYNWTIAVILPTLVEPFLFVALLLLGVSGYAFLKRSQDWGARALFLFSVSLFCTGLSSIINQTTDVLLPTILLSAFFSFLIFGILIFPSFLMLALSFPKPKRFVGQHPNLTIFVVYAATPILMIMTGNLGIGWITVIIFALLSLASVIHSAVTTKDAVGRAQIRWAVTGVAIGAVAFIINNLLALSYAANPVQVDVPRFLIDLPFTIGILAPALGFAIAILRYRLFDIDLIIRKTLVYTALTVTLALVFFGGVTLLQQVVGRLTGIDNSPVAIVISTLLIAALFSPLRRRIQDFIDRCFYRRKYNAEQALEAFASAARDEADIEHLSAELLAVVQETMQPEQISLWLRQQENRRS